MRLPFPRGTSDRPSVYSIFTRSLVRGEAPLARLERLLRAGVTVVQIREKQADRSELLEFLRDVRRLTSAHGVPLIVNDDPHLAVEAGADGVHVGQGDLSPSEARRIVGDHRWVGVSTHSAAEIDRALGEDTDVLGFGPCFPTTTKDAGPTLSPALLAAVAAREFRVPIYPIGGIDVTRAAELCAFGFRNAAVSSHLLASDDPERRLEGLIRALRGRGA